MYKTSHNLCLLFCAFLAGSSAFFPLSSPGVTGGGVIRSPTLSSDYPSSNRNRLECALFGGFMDDVGKFMKRFTTKATASHILIKGGAEAENKLEDLKIEIGDSLTKFVEAAAQYSECPSASSGGNLGEFGPGAMVKEFDEVVFSKEVGKVHGPVKTQFGYHLIYIRERTE